MLAATYSRGLNNISPLQTKKGFYKSLLIFDLVSNLSFIIFHHFFLCEVLRVLFTNFFATFLFAKFFTYVKVRDRMLNQQ